MAAFLEGQFLFRCGRAGFADLFSLRINASLLEFVIKIVLQDASSKISLVDFLVFLEVVDIGNDFYNFSLDVLGLGVGLDGELAVALFDVLKGGLSGQVEDNPVAVSGGYGFGVLPADGVVFQVIVVLGVQPVLCLLDGEVRDWVRWAFCWGCWGDLGFLLTAEGDGE